ncbi:MAG: hypothetical protein CM1200mP3_15950 [Chloroflexota bacterium]|nr:MAG: hypothetical protein CM1200mP3_15950 [Chloroflexota bacterium]
MIDSLLRRDGFGLAYMKVAFRPHGEPMEFIIPARAMQEVGRLIGSDNSEVEFTVTSSGTHALFKMGTIEMFHSLCQAHFRISDR